MKLFIVGINGKMGKAVCAYAENAGYTVAGGIDVAGNDKYKVFSSAEEVDVSYDVLVDFSRPATLDMIIKLAEKFGKPVVLATTGYSEEQSDKIAALSKKVPVFKSANMSLGVNVVAHALKFLTAALSGYDIEIIEAHHNQKVDAPSGTAKLLLDSVKGALDYSPRVVYGREGDAKRAQGDIGVHAVRGGTIVGEHTVMFAGEDEMIEIKHTALSRKILASGGVEAAAYICGKKPGMYDMNDYLTEKNI